MKNSSSVSAPSSGKVKSPSNTKAEQASTLGGYPPEKNVQQIADANDPSKRKGAPGAVRGV